MLQTDALYVVKIKNSGGPHQLYILIWVKMGICFCDLLSFNNLDIELNF